ncbi:MarR family transcriptional regulator [Microbacterium sp. cx-55]|uniref:MarR family winged helix-turn-helix transcriptional regulator n=1 Tax=Microbacterium sp. cx-55 TaxID=2875948 RepID=UPI001CBBC9F7|nr:MarR family transcriptional regulator [Microbacterium sp. cx-55]UGB34795.1 MarR family transcriptional regulator [Microbacterium sp. cx-55]
MTFATDHPDAASRALILDEMVCFSLYSASRATTQAYRRLLEPWGITYPQYLVLGQLWTRGPLSVRTLGDDLGLDSGTLSPLITRLENAGIVTRSRTETDRRIVTVALTDRGQTLRGEMAEVPAQLITCMGLSLDSARILINSLHALTESVQATPAG